MKIIDKNNQPVVAPDLAKGYLIPDRLLVAHHDAIPAVAEIWHHEVAAEYENGGKDLIRVIDVPGRAAQPARDEYEDVMRYVAYSPEELISQKRPTMEQRLDNVERLLRQLIAGVGK